MNCEQIIMIKELVLKNKKFLIIGILLLIAVDFFNLMPAWFIGTIVDSIKDKSADFNSLFKYFIIIIIFAFCIGFTRFGYRFFIISNARKIESEIREKLYSHLQLLSANFYNKSKIGDLMAHSTNDISAIWIAVGMGVITLTDAILWTIMTFFMLLLISPELTLIAIIPLPFIPLIALIGGKLLHKRFRIVQDAFARITGKITENLNNIRVIKAYVQEKEEIQNIKDIGKDYIKHALKLAKISSGFAPSIFMVAGASQAIILYFGGEMVINSIIGLGDNNLTLGNFVRFSSYIMMLTWPMLSLGFTINLFQRAKASLLRINKILETPSENNDPENPKTIIELQGEIKFNNLSFKYDTTDKNIVENVSLIARPFQTIAIVGETGSGKSTLMQLLLRIYNPPKNTIFIDNIDITEMHSKYLRNLISYVPQDIFLFSATIAENIAFGMPDASMDQIIEASKLACIYESIMDFPNKFDTIVGERGITLSGGQKQRVALARAIIRKPNILILDDTFSAIDTETEDNILNNIKNVVKTRTTIIISHRIATIQNADYVYVLNEGIITEQGKHSDLLLNGKFYYDIYKKQQLEEQLK